MSPRDTLPDRLWDVAVIGGGLAGSLVAERLRDAGTSVIVLESGPARTGGGAADRAAGRWPAPILLRGKPGRTERPAAAILGHGPGGSSALYGAALERFRAEDFAGTRPAPEGALPTAWPLDAAGMARWYDAAETRLGLAGAREDGSFLGRLPPICARDRAIADRLLANGHNPYRLPVTIAYRPGCNECPAQRCDRGCKGEGWTSVLSGMEQGADFRLLTGAHVERAEPGADGTVRLALASGGGVRARNLVLAAGALNSPRLLLNSPALFDGAPHALIGRGLMFHSTDLFTVTPPAELTVGGPKKTLGLRDFYDLPSGRGGEIQSLGFDLAPRLVSRHLAEIAAARGVPGGAALMTLLRVPAAMIARRWGSPPVFATILEDLPYPENRVAPAEDGFRPDRPVVVDYRAAPELAARWHEMRAAAKRAFAPLPVRFLLRRVAPNLGHPCGSVRMGDDPAHAPADADGRLRGTDLPVHLADASLFPSSGGTNPALTVAANALRIADGIARRIG